MSRHPRLVGADREIRVSQDMVRHLEGIRDGLVDDLVNEALGTSYKHFELEHSSTWNCPDDMLEDGEEPKKGPVSPTGKCVYLPKDDPARDHCLFCHGPDERK